MQDLEITPEKTRAKSTSKQRCSWSSILEYGKVDGMFSSCTPINCNVQSLHIAIYRCKPGAINWNLPTFEVEQNIRCIDSAASHLEGMGLEGVDITVKMNYFFWSSNSMWQTFCLNIRQLVIFDNLTQQPNNFSFDIQVDDHMLRFYDDCDRYLGAKVWHSNKDIHIKVVSVT